MGAGDLLRTLDELIETCTQAVPGEIVAAARAGFEERRGRVFEDEELWEMVTRVFLEWYVLERLDPATHAPAAAAHLAGERGAQVRAWLRSHRSLFVIDSVSHRHVDLTDVIGGAPFRVTEARSFKGVARGEVIEARLAGFEGRVYFGRGFVFHPGECAGAIADHVQVMRERGHRQHEIVDFCARLRVRCERYQHVDPVRIYEGTSDYSAVGGPGSGEPARAADGPGAP